jgi:hypothetical protein
MPKIPDYLDYGARPSLRTTRVDMPNQAGTMVADALATAANRFANVMQERKGQHSEVRKRGAAGFRGSEDHAMSPKNAGSTPLYRARMWWACRARFQN